MTAARWHCMARPHIRKLITWCCTVPASVVLVICLFLPQVQDCNGRTKTAFDTNTWPFMVVLAIIGVLPIAWQWRPLRQPILLMIGVATASVLIMSVLGIPVLIALALTRSMTDEEAVALCSFTLVLAFVLMFPVAMMFGDWRRGAELTWAAAWLELFGTIWWASAATELRPLQLRRWHFIRPRKLVQKADQVDDLRQQDVHRGAGGGEVLGRELLRVEPARQCQCIHRASDGAP